MDKKTIWETIPKVMIIIETILLYIISWGIGTFLLNKSFSKIDLNNPNKISITYYIFMILGILLLLLPFAKRVKVGNILEVERQLNETKKELESFKNQVNMNLGVIFTAINTVGNINSNTSNINNYINTMPSNEEIKNGKKELDEAVKENKVIDEIEIDNEKNIFELLKIRIKLETLLRDQILKVGFEDINDKRNTMHFMYRYLMQIYPELERVYSTFRYVIGICNRAAHAQYIAKGEDDEAIYMGKKLILFIEELFEKRAVEPTN